MITTEAREIDPRGYVATKYASAFTEYLSDLAMFDMERGSGDAECPTGYFTQLGKRILFSDSQGFVWHETYNDADGARAVFDALERYWIEWDYTNDWNDEADRSEVAQMLILDQCDRYISYCVACDAEQCSAFEFDAWVLHDEPVGPLGGDVSLDVWLRTPDGEEEAEAEANTYVDGGLYRVDWSLTSVGLVKSRTFANYDEARAWLESEGFDDYSTGGGAS